MSVKIWLARWVPFVACTLATVSAPAQLAVVSSAETGGPTPEQLAEEIIDQAGGVQLCPGTVTTEINAAGDPDSEERAMGLFTGGMTPAGTLLPPQNQPPNDPPVTYAGGLGVVSGVCLCTGLASDNDPVENPQGLPQQLGVGVQGPNNGSSLTVPPPPGTPALGEITFDLGKPSDADFVSEVAAGFDATVLSFEIELQSPGILSLTYVHGTDEWPRFPLATFNDTFLVFIRNANCPESEFQNFILFRKPHPITGEGIEGVLSLTDLRDCGFLKNNLVAPAPSGLLSSLHADFNQSGFVDANDLATPRYDHEFGGFTKPLAFETSSSLETSPLYRKALAPGVYNIKMVIQDVNDKILDSAAFIASNSLTLFPLRKGDYNGDGVVDAEDYDIWSESYSDQVYPATFYQGDGNGDCVVNTVDYTIWRDNLGQTGNGDFSADFNRDGVVNAIDYVILTDNYPIDACASRFQGDADGDGDVDYDDYTAWQGQYGGGGSGSLMAAAEEGAFDDATLADLASALIQKETNRLTKAAAPLVGALTRESTPEDPDLNGDGVFDAEEKAELDAIILGEPQ